MYNKLPLISIIIPVFNTIEYLPRCMESVLNQTYKNLEIILINDGSTDKSGEKCDEYAKKDIRVKVIHKQNSGVSSARNVGLDEACGEWIGFVDSDDWIELNMYETLFRAVNRSGKQIAVCGYLEDNGNGFTIERASHEIPAVISRMETLLDVVYTFNFGCSMCNKLFNRNLFDTGYPTRLNTTLYIGEDSVFIVETFMRIDGLIYIPEPFYHYYQRENSATHSFNEKNLTELEAWEHILRIISPISKEIKRLAQAHYTEVAVRNLYCVARYSANEYISVLKKAARRYALIYFIFGKVKVKLKLRSAAIIFFPKISNYIWLTLKKRFNIIWWKGKDL